MEDDDPPGPVLSLWFWLAIALAFICIAAGAVVGVYGPKLFPPHDATPHAPVPRTLGPHPLGPHPLGKPAPRR